MRRGLVVLLLCVLTGCGGGGGGEDAASTPAPQLDPPEATEPVPGPALEEDPPGTVVEVGSRPEGVAVDPESGLAAVAVQDPNRLVLVDTRLGEVAREVPLPGSARHVQLAAPGGPFLVGAETANELVEVTTRGQRRTTAVGDHPHDATRNGDRVYTADEFGSTMSVVRDNRLVGQVAVDVQPGGVVGVGDKVAIISVRAYTVELFPAGEDEPRGEGAQSAGLGPSHVVSTANGRLAITDTRGQALIVYDTEPRLRFKARLPLEGTPVGITSDPERNRAWVALSERAEAVPADLAADEPRLGEPVDTVRDPYSLGVDPGTGRLAVASRSDGTLQLVDP